MFFESRAELLPTHPDFNQVRHAFQRGKVREALELLQALKIECEVGPEEFLFYGELMRSVGKERRFQAVIRWSLRHWPDHFHLRIQWTRILCIRGRLLDAYLLLQELYQDQRIDSRNQQIVVACLASVTSQMNCKELYLEYARLATSSAFEDALQGLVYYELCYCCLCLKNWNEAIQWGERSLKLLPSWPRLRVMLGRAYLAVDRHADALHTMNDLIEHGFEDVTLEHLRLMQRYADAEWSDLVKHVDAFVSKWNLTVLERRQFDNLLVLSCWLSGDQDRAREIASEDSWLTQLSTQEGQTGERQTKLIRLPYLNQEQHLCVPTSVVMIASAQGERLNPSELYSEVRGHEGTALWRMVERMQSRGYRTECVNLSTDSVHGFIDQGVPLLVPYEDIFSNHVQVICGYDSSLNLYFVRDPESPIPLVRDASKLEEVYGMAGQYAIALIAPDQTNAIRIDPSWRSVIGDAFLRLGAAAESSNLDAAREAYELIPDGSPASLRRDSLAYGIVITPKNHRDNLVRIAKDSNQMELVRMKALMQVGDPSLLETDELASLPLPSFMKHYFGMLKEMHNDSWENADRIANSLLKQYASMDSLWLAQAEIKINLGQMSDAKNALNWAKHIAPSSVWLKQRFDNYFPSLKTYADRVRSVEQYKVLYPYAYELNDIEVELYAYSGDGLQYEAAILEQIARRPLISDAYCRLASWYISQDRIDLAKRIIESGRLLIGEDELPIADWENDSEDIAPPALDTSKEFIRRIAVAERTSHELIDEAYSLIGEEDERAVEVMRELAKREDGGVLLWHELANLLAIRIIIIGIHSRRNGEAFSLDSLVSKRLPGRLPYSFNLLCDRLDVLQFDQCAAAALYRWCEPFLKDAEWSEHMQFNIGILKEASGELEAAETIYKEIVQKCPGYSGARYRLAILCQLRSDFKGAYSAFIKTLESDPTNVGALQSIIDLINSGHGDGKVEKFLQKWSNLLPYSFHHVVSRIDYALDTGIVERAYAILKSGKAYMTDNAYRALTARIAFAKDDYVTAFKEAEAAIELSDIDVKRHALVTLCDAAEATEDFDRLREGVLLGMKDYPDDIYFIHRHVECLLSNRQNQEAEAFILKILGEKGIHNAMIFSFFKARTRFDIRGVEVLVTSISKHNLDYLLQGLSEVYEGYANPEEQYQLYEYINANYPDSIDIRARYAQFLVMAGKSKTAVKVAKDIESRDISGRSWDYLLGYCYQDLDPKRSITYFEKNYKDSGSLDALTRLARGYHVSGKRKRARELYEEALQKAPYDELIITNLIVLGDSPGRHFDAIYHLVKNGMVAPQSQYLHVHAVMSAMESGKQLPEAWLGQAIARFEQLLVEEAFQDEKPRLAAAITQWMKYKGEAQEAKRYRRHLPFILTRIFSNWPKSDVWIAQ